MRKPWPPVIPTIVVGIAAAIMVTLGFWQLGRADEKATMIAQYSAVQIDAAAQFLKPEETEALLYRKVIFECTQVLSVRSTAGTSDRGQKGWAHVAQCSSGQGEKMEVVLGWSKEANSPAWPGGRVTGILGQRSKIVADPPLADLAQLAKPDPADLPNNHLAYAGQWFLFALTALVIYWLAIRQRRLAAIKE